ncbi:MAG: NAD(P)H-dependent oxidoreductase [Candidatus Heimdallarchaeota archaeon]|nr:NAD(P)H-dependent oxidoreductase [Candidatus Heimdallarchaeota archaeon]
MKILCISAAQVLNKREIGTSIMVCQTLDKIIKEKHPDYTSEVFSLLDHELQICDFCGDCISGRCSKDRAFNQLLNKLAQANHIFLVIPHYMIIPSKLTILLEKLNQIYYTTWLRDNSEPWILQGKSISLLAHGGGDERSFINYQKFIIDPLNYVFTAFQMKVIPFREKEGYIFGINGFRDADDSIFPDVQIDWISLTNDLHLLVKETILAL